jgi:hypothetical protein
MILYYLQDGKPMDDSPRMKFIHEDDNFTMLIYEVRPEDAGDYACVAINNVGKATCTAKLCVEGKRKCITTFVLECLICFQVLCWLYM